MTEVQAPLNLTSVRYVLHRCLKVSKKKHIVKVKCNAVYH